MFKLTIIFWLEGLNDGSGYWLGLAAEDNGSAHLDS